MLRSPILWKLFATYVALAGACLAGAGYATRRMLIDDQRTEVERSLLDRARILAPTLERRLDENSAGFESFLRDVAHEIGCRVTIIRADGVVLAESERDPAETDDHSNRPEFVEAMRGAAGKSVRRSVTLSKELLYVAIPLGSAEPPQRILRLALPLDVDRRSASRVAEVLLWTGAFGIIASLVIGFLTARRLTRPLADMTHVAGRYTQGDYRHRVRTQARDEVGELGRALNLMGEELEHKIQTIQRDREETRTILSAMVEGVVAVDRTGKVLLVNEAARKIFGLDGLSPEGRHLTEVLRNSQVLPAVDETLERGRPSAFEVEMVHGSERVLEAQAAPIKGVSGGAVIVFHDISRLRKLENVRRDFVANVSHELKTPLTSIKGYVETLLSGGIDDTENNLRFLRKVAANADRLHALITDLLSLSRLESEVEPYALAVVDLRAIVERSVASFRDHVAAKGMAIEITTERTALRVVGDDGALTQVVDNLLDNAIKYTPDGGRVTIDLARDAGRIRLAVQDTGIGIPAKDLPRIFERFYRVDRARSRELGGTGLGLAIVKHIVQALRGSVEVTSELAKGSRFVVTLCAAEDPPAGGAPPASPRALNR